MREEKPEVANLLRDLSGRVHGAVLTPENSDFEPARRVWNASIDRQPAAVLVCADDNDVSVALRAAFEHGVRTTVRGGGHNAAGRALADGALLLDLSRMRQVKVDARAQVATAQGGALWRDIDVATAQHALATTGGMISNTGVVGLTLGGGTGWLMRKYGLAIDNLLRARVVLADGRAVSATINENADLFYALRGGGGGLGVVTAVDFKLYPLQEVLAGLVVRPGAEAATVLRQFRAFAQDAPDEYCGMVVLTNAPPFPFLDPSWHGRPVVIHAMCWSGDPVAGQQAIEAVRRSGTVLAEHIGTMPYAKWQQALDASVPAGRQVYWKTASYAGLTDTTINLLAQAVYDLPTPLTELHVQHLGGAISRVPDADTAFSLRSAQFFINLVGFTESKSEFPVLRARVRSLYDQLAGQALPSLLPNFTNEDDGDVAEHFSASQRTRLYGIRNRYDPKGILALSRQ